jgi:hypothetical protein
MSQHNVTLSYTTVGARLGPNVNPVKVRVGDTIAFAQSGGPTGAKAKVTLAYKQGFSKKVFVQGDAAIKVTGEIKNTPYTCELVLNGNQVPIEIAGGEIDPET